MDAAGRGYIYAIRASQNVAYRDRDHVIVLLKLFVWLTSLLDRAPVVGRSPSSLALTQDAALEIGLGRFFACDASEPQWRPLALGLRLGDDELFVVGALDPRKLDRASLSQVT